MSKFRLKLKQNEIFAYNYDKHILLEVSKLLKS